MKTDFHNKDFALSLALKWRLRWTRKWPTELSEWKGCVTSGLGADISLPHCQATGFSNLAPKVIVGRKSRGTTSLGTTLWCHVQRYLRSFSSFYANNVVWVSYFLVLIYSTTLKKRKIAIFATFQNLVIICRIFIWCLLEGCVQKCTQLDTCRSQ